MAKKQLNDRNELESYTADYVEVYDKYAVDAVLEDTNGTTQLKSTTC